MTNVFWMIIRPLTSFITFSAIVLVMKNNIAALSSFPIFFCENLMRIIFEDMYMEEEGSGVGLL